MENSKIDEFNNCIVHTVDEGEGVADLLAAKFDVKEENYPEINNTFTEFIGDYKKKNESESDENWLIGKFNKHSDLWNNDKDAIENDAKEIVKTVHDFYQAKQELDEHCSKGRDKESWLEKKIEQGATAAGTVGVMQYGACLDTAIGRANEAMESTIRCLDGHINRNPNLDGFIAEQHHVDTFNLDAAAKESGFYAETLKSTNKNSVDIVIKDSRGNIVRKYQSKYCENADASSAAFEEGKYNFQRKLVPQGQGKDIPNANEKIEIRAKNKGTEKIESTPLSKEEAKEIQRKAQEEGVIPEYDWTKFKIKDMSKAIGKRAAVAAAFAVGFQGARILGRRIFNKLTGKQNNTVGEDVQEFVKSSLESGGSAGLTVAASGAMTVIVKRGFLGSVLKHTPAGRIAAAVSIGVENIKTLYRFAKGELTGEQALDHAGKNTCSLIGALAGSAKGASIGATIGMTLGPVGSFIGGLAGGIVGGIAGSTVGEAVYNAGKTIVKHVCSAVKKIGSTVVSGVKKLGNFVKGIFA